METVRTKTSASARTRSVAFVGLAIAIIAVSAWVTVPLGPIPFTLQMFAVTFAVVVLSPKEAIASIAGYLLLGAVGVPVFSGMRGGIGVLAGPTGGFLWGYLLGVAAAALFLYVVRTRLGVAGGKSALAGPPRSAVRPQLRRRSCCRHHLHGHRLCVRVRSVHGGGPGGSGHGVPDGRCPLHGGGLLQDRGCRRLRRCRPHSGEVGPAGGGQGAYLHAQTVLARRKCPPGISVRCGTARGGTSPVPRLLNHG